MQVAMTACARRWTMREVATELKDLRLYGMSSAWEDLVAQGNTVGLQTASWLVEHLLDMEHADRAMRSIRYQLHSAKFPVHRDLAGFEFDQSKVDQGLIKELATLSFTEAAHNGNVQNVNIASNAAIADSKLAGITTAGKVNGSAITGLANTPAGAGVLPGANLGSGTPSASTYLS